MFHKVSYKWVRRTQYITPFGLFYKEVGRLWRLSDCEELVGGQLQEMMEMPLSRVLVSEVVIICNCPICN